MSIYDDEILNRFWSKVITNDTDKCWEWVASCDTKGYGKFGIKIGIKNKVIGAHIFSYQNHYNKKVKKGLYVLHSCDNRKCVNPNHLSEGTAKDNSDDMVNKNRQAKGENHGRRKLNQAQVDLIRIKNDIYRNITTYSLAEEFGVSKRTISNIISFKNWI